MEGFWDSQTLFSKGFEPREAVLSYIHGVVQRSGKLACISVAGVDGQCAVEVAQPFQRLPYDRIAPAPEIATTDVVGKEGITCEHHAGGRTEVAD